VRGITGGKEGPEEMANFPAQLSFAPGGYCAIDGILSRFAKESIVFSWKPRDHSGMDNFTARCEKALKRWIEADGKAKKKSPLFRLSR
jgi:hypothetical protein